MLRIGDLVPKISLQNQDNERVSLSSFCGEKPLVIFFYPKNNTPGCTAEMCSFRDHYEAFRDVGAEVIGISGDTSASHKKVQAKRKLPFLLLSDSDRSAEKAFGVPRNLFGMLPGRVTFVTDLEGKIIHVFNSSSNPTKHISESIKALQASL